MFVERLEPRQLLAGEKILFIRGGSGTGGSVAGGTTAQRDAQMADINNTSTAANNAGWGELAQLLRNDGFVVSQTLEGAYPNNTPVNLAGMDLSQYAAIVFGSNNADYTPNGSTTQVNALANYVSNGGAALFISDANFARTWGGGATSDQDFLTRFGLVMNQDSQTYSISRAGGDFTATAHPILSGVNQIDGEGVSPITDLPSQVSDVTTQVLVRARNQVRNNDSASGKGSDRAVTVNDAALIVSTLGKGRVVGHYDRNTFFNTNGVGTSLGRFNNRVYAQNLFRFLAGRFTSRPQVVASEFRYDASPQSVRVVFSENVQASLPAGDLSLRNLSTGQTFTPANVTWNSASNRAEWRFASRLPDGAYRATIGATAIADSSGNTMAANHSYDFFVLAGDANRDGKVTSQDSAILVSSFGRGNSNFWNGDFNYDRVVDARDFNYLAGRFGAAANTVFSLGAPQVLVDPTFTDPLNRPDPVWSDLAKYL